MDLLYQCDFIALSFHLNYAMVIKEQGVVGYNLFGC